MTNGQRVLALSCGLEALTGLGMLVAPAVVVKLIFGTGVEGSATIIGKIAGLALLSLAIACWPSGATGRGACFALLFYNLLVGLLLAVTAATATTAGLLLWLVVVSHLTLAALIALTGRGSAPLATHKAN